MTYKRLSAMKTPTLMLTGGADLLSPPAMMKLVAEQIPNCQFEVIPEAGHAAFYERPEVWNQFVLEFIAEHSE
ncbi:MAG: alpha/beta hydrolase, partial [Dehalococcoidia bacterium]|nr:alpha/beta hydrolase [Dehalococcoidia bacterium]